MFAFQYVHLVNNEQLRGPIGDVPEVKSCADSDWPVLEILIVAQGLMDPICRHEAGKKHI